MTELLNSKKKSKPTNNNIKASQNQNYFPSTSQSFIECKCVRTIKEVSEAEGRGCVGCSGVRGVVRGESARVLQDESTLQEIANRSPKALSRHVLHVRSLHNIGKWMRSLFVSIHYKAFLA